MIRINEDYIEGISQEEIIRNEVISDSDDYLAIQMKKALRITFPGSDNSENFFNKIIQFRDALTLRIRRMFAYNANIGNYFITEWQFGLEEYDKLFTNDDVENSRLHFYVFFDDEFKTSQSVIWFFNKFNEVFWDVYHKIVEDSDDFYYRADLFVHNENGWNDVTDYSMKFEEFMDRDYLVGFVNNFWLYYKVLEKFGLHKNTYSTLSGICSPSRNISDMMENGSIYVGSPTRDTDVTNAHIRQFFTNMRFKSLKKFISDDYISKNVRFLFVDADKDPNTIEYIDKQITKYIKDELNYFNGVLVYRYIEQHDAAFQFFLFYMGCFWINGLHRHLFVSVILDKDIDVVKTSKQIMKDMFGPLNSYFNKEFS